MGRREGQKETLEPNPVFWPMGKLTPRQGQDLAKVKLLVKGTGEPGSCSGLQPGVHRVFGYRK